MLLNFRKVYYLRVFVKNLLLSPAPTICYWYIGRAERGRGVVVWAIARNDSLEFVATMTIFRILDLSTTCCRGEKTL